SEGQYSAIDETRSFTLSAAIARHLGSALAACTGKSVGGHRSCAESIGPAEARFHCGRCRGIDGRRNDRGHAAWARPSPKSVSALLQSPPQARACYVLAHGAGAGMDHPFMVAVAAGLAVRGIASLRYQFPYMERGAKRPDPPGLAQAAVRAAVSMALEALAGL